MLLYNKYRPRVLTDIAGQTTTVKVLENMIKSNNIRPCYIFSGHKGTGKTTIARILAKMVNCQKGITAEPCMECANCIGIDDGSVSDVQEIDAASYNKVDDIRALNDRVRMASLGARYKVWVLDEAHMLTKQAWNAFLKTLEEPPPNVIFIICTTEFNQIPETVKCRCLRFNFTKLKIEDIYAFLVKVCEKEGVQYEEIALRTISKNAKGGMRDALTDLERAVIAADSGVITESIASQITLTIDYKYIKALAECISTGNMRGGFIVSQYLEKSGIAANTLLEELIEYLHNVYSYQLVKSESVLLFTTNDQKNDILNLANTFDNEKLADAISVLCNAFKVLPFNPNPRYFLDVTLHQAMKAYRH